MKREILFRGKRVDNGEWVYGDLYQEKHPFKNELKQVMIVEYRPDLCLVSGANDSNHYWREVHPETVCQFTGLLDKNGNKIFEYDFDQNYEVVKWCEKRNGYALSTYDHPTKDFIHCNCYSCEGHYEITDVINEIEITGNIHDK